MNSPSTDVSDLVKAIHAIPANGITTSKMEIRSITAGNTPPGIFLSRTDRFSERLGPPAICRLAAQTVLGLGLKSHVNRLAVFSSQGHLLILLA